MESEKARALARVSDATDADLAAQQDADEARGDLFEAIIAAHRAGASDQEIADVTETLGRSRIQQIRTGYRKPRKS